MSHKITFANNVISDENTAVMYDENNIRYVGQVKVVGTL